MTLIKVGWVPVYEPTNQICWDKFTTIKPPAGSELFPPGWHWHCVRISRRVRA